MSSPIAHAAVAVAGKPLTKKVPLWLLIVATQVPDLLFFVFQALGMEHTSVTNVDLMQGYTYLEPALTPWSHGLMMCLVWALVLGGITYLFYRTDWESALVGLLVMSHWLLDVIAYPNMPLFLEGSKDIGLAFVTKPIGVKAFIGIEILGLGFLAYSVVRNFVSRRRAKMGQAIREA